MSKSIFFYIIYLLLLLVFFKKKMNFCKARVRLIDDGFDTRLGGINTNCLKID